MTDTLSQQIPTNLQNILEIARPIAWGASDILRSYYRGEPKTGDLNIEEKKGGPVTAADLAVNHYIVAHLQQAIDDEDFGYLTEETYDPRTGKLPQSWVWIIDPLDGTRDFIDKTGEYAIHIALTYQGKLVLALVAIPEAEKLYYATLGGGTFVETADGSNTQLQVSTRSNLEDLTLVASRTHRDDRFDALLKRLSLTKQKLVGSVGCKVTNILEQNADVYISLSGKSAPKDWDMAAPELILTEAGGKFTHVDGTPLRYNHGDVSQWGCLIASNGHCHDTLCSEAEKLLAELDKD
ncbi:3'(2'),5'-bisphosphate nucleotidase CysQ family protein [Merismopedia glauca]|uniref:inositol-phosphate phosphatase n=1 Tax=Merismopedia glauca CCAP 1448/3 TaxID=1296344 RepID=A0A2T1CA31_9CYAN|nr:3'(2'),5'-bisphosphate nucleotidase CysQ [Merismopedia glauca]PSB05099.1 3'(2'),5'-bisphosphate nucleotidase CysQ [Merismopedia glauca CCAP 1448/3]